ncbi:hypothetical protein GCM10010485_21500 [Streptosporangium carneum]
MEASRFFMIRWYISTGIIPASLALTCRANSAEATTGGGSSAEGRLTVGEGDGEEGGVAVPAGVGVAVFASEADVGGAAVGSMRSTVTAAITTTTLESMMICVSGAELRTKLPYPSRSWLDYHPRTDSGRPGNRSVTHTVTAR